MCTVRAVLCSQTLRVKGRFGVLAVFGGAQPQPQNPEALTAKRAKLLDPKFRNWSL